MPKPIPPLDLSWLLIESPTSPTHVGAMLLFKKPAGRTPVVREIVKALRAQGQRAGHRGLQTFAADVANYHQRRAVSGL